MRLYRGVLDGYPHRSFKVLCILLIVYVILGFLLFIWGLFLGKANVTTLLITCAGLVFLILLPYVKGKMSYKQYLTMTNGGSIQKKTVFYRDHLEILINGTVVNLFRYCQVKKAAVTKNCYVLCFPNLVFCFVRRDGFTEEEFKTVQKLVDKLKKR